MKAFDLFSSFLKTCPKIGPFYVLAYKGNDMEFASDYTYYNGKKIVYKSMSDRKTECEKATTASIELFIPDTRVYTIKSVYRNTKGVYFNHGNKKYYIS